MIGFFQCFLFILIKEKSTEFNRYCYFGNLWRSNILLIGCGNLGSLILDVAFTKKRIYVLEENEKIKVLKKNCKFITKIDKSVLIKIKYVLFCVKPMFESFNRKI